MGRVLLWSGAVLLAVALITMGVGLLLNLLGARAGRLLPGDIVISRPGFVFAFPLATSLLVSLLLTLLLWALHAWRR